MLKFGNSTCTAQIAARPKSSIPFYEKLSTYVSPMVSDYLLESIWLYSLSLIGILKVEMLYVGMILLFFLGNQFWDKHH